MGYRSDVHAVVYPDWPEKTEESKTQAECTAEVEEKYEALKLLMSTTFANIVEENGNCMEWVDNCQQLRFQIYDVKWYSSYKDVKEFVAFLEAVAELGYSAETIRIGEEDGDVERDTYGKDCQYVLSTSTSVHFDGGC